MKKGTTLSAVTAAAAFLLRVIAIGMTGIDSGALRTVPFIAFFLLRAIGLCVSAWTVLMCRAFSRNGKRRTPRRIVAASGGSANCPRR